MKQFLYQAEWLGLDKELREKLKEVFAINRSEGMSVVNGQLTSDGCSQADLLTGITIGKMIDYLDDTSFGMNTDNSEKLFDELFERVVNKANVVLLDKLEDEDKSDSIVIDNGTVTGILNSNITKNGKTKVNQSTKSKSEGAKIKSKGDKQSVGSGDDRPSGDDSINAGSGDRQDIQRPKTTDKGKRAGHTSGKRSSKSKKTN